MHAAGNGVHGYTLQHRSNSSPFPHNINPKPKTQNPKPTTQNPKPKTPHRSSSGLLGFLVTCVVAGPTPKLQPFFPFDHTPFAVVACAVLINVRDVDSMMPQVNPDPFNPNPKPQTLNPKP